MIERKTTDSDVHLSRHYSQVVKVYPVCGWCRGFETSVSFFLNQTMGRELKKLNNFLNIENCTQHEERIKLI